MWDNIRSAFRSIWSNKLRSLLTLLGVVIGVTSVITLVSLGQGLKNDVSDLVRGFGTNVLVVISGKMDTQNINGSAGNPADLVSADILTQTDVATLQKMPDLVAVSPLSLVGGLLQRGALTANQSTLVGAYPNLLEAFQILSIAEGRMFTAGDGKVIVLSQGAKERLFGSQNALGEKVTVGKEEFRVIGVLGQAKANSLFNSGLSDISIIPFDQATALNKGQVKIMRIAMKAADSADVAAVKASVHQKLLANHDEVENFTVLTQDDILSLLDQFLNLSTAMVSAIAAISLLVGGIGIMNIMLVTVTERTREIGLRKAIGATGGAILVQFLTEAVTITLVGGLIGLGLSVLIGRIVSWKTPLTPDFTWQVVVLSLGISVVIGVIFGLWPAIRAGKKDPIEALRYE